MVLTLVFVWTHSSFFCVGVETLATVLKVPEEFSVQMSVTFWLFEFNTFMNIDLLLLQCDKKLLISSSSPREEEA